jgi:hypothetical protein
MQYAYMDDDIARFFPKEGEVSLSNWFVRKAIYNAHNQNNFWNMDKLKFEDMVLDHVWPKAKGGPDNVFNLVPTSYEINATKRDHLDKQLIIPVLYIINVSFSKKAYRVLERQKQLIFQKEQAKLEIKKKMAISGSPYIKWMQNNKKAVENLIKEDGELAFEILASLFEEEKILNCERHMPTLLSIKKAAIKIGIII